MTDVNKAIELNSDEPVFYFNRGNVHYDLNMYDEAHNDYDTAIEIEPKNPRYWHSKGLAYQKTEQPELVEMAIKMYKQALTLDKKYFGSRFHLGMMYHQNKQFHEALAAYSEVLKNYNNDKEIYIR